MLYLSFWKYCCRFEITIRDLAGLIARLVALKGKIAWDKSRPDGQPRKCLDISKAEEEVGFKAKTCFEEPFKKTIEWYRNKADDDGEARF